MVVSNDLVMKRRGTRSPSSPNNSTSSASSSTTTARCFSCFAPTTDDDDDCFLPTPSSTSSDSSSVLRRKSLSGSIKSFFSKSPLSKKIRSKRNRSNKFELRLTGPGDNKLLSTLGDDVFSEPGECFGEGSDHSSSLLTLTTATSSISSTGFEQAADQDLGQTTGTKDKFRQMVKRVRTALNNHGIMYMFLIMCLAALVFWGKALAIATCTSAWIFFSQAKEAAMAVAAQSGNWTDGWSATNQIKGKNGFG